MTELFALPLGLTLAEMGMIVGAAGGPTAIVTAYMQLREAAPKERGMVLDVGQKGMNILDGLLDRTTIELEREVKARERCEERLTRLYDDLQAKNADIKDKDQRIRQEQAAYRFMLEQRDEEIRQLIQKVTGEADGD